MSLRGLGRLKRLGKAKNLIRHKMREGYNSQGFNILMRPKWAILCLYEVELIIFSMMTSTTMTLLWE